MQYQSDRFYLSKSLVKSKVFKSLTKTSTTMYFNFLLKCRVEKPGGKRGRIKPWPITNNGELVYTYAEAEANGIPRSSFMRGLDDLVEKGLIDIAYRGNGLKGDKSKYAISLRWKKWDTDSFIKKKRQRDIRLGRGFQKKV